MNVMKRVPIKEQEPHVRAANFEEVCLGYSKEEAMEEAERYAEKNCEPPYWIDFRMVIK